MPDPVRVPEALAARLTAALGGLSADAAAGSIAARAGERLHAVLDLVGDGRGVRESGSGLNAASMELLVADALLTDASARAAADGSIDGLLRALDVEALAARARALDEHTA